MSQIDDLTLTEKQQLALLLYNDPERKHIFNYVKNNRFNFRKNKQVHKRNKVYFIKLQNLKNEIQDCLVSGKYKDINQPIYKQHKQQLYDSISCFLINKNVSILYKFIFYMLYFTSLVHCSITPKKCFKTPNAILSQIQNFNTQLKNIPKKDISVINSLRQIYYIQTQQIDKLFPEFPYAYKKVMPSSLLPDFINELTKSQSYGPILKIDIVSRHGYRYPARYVNPKNNRKGDITKEGEEQLEQWHKVIETIREKHNLRMNVGQAGVKPGSGRLQKSCEILSGKPCLKNVEINKNNEKSSSKKKKSTILNQMLKERGEQDFENLRDTISDNKETIQDETHKLQKKHKKRLLNTKDMISVFENNINQYSKENHVNIFVSSDSSLIAFFNKYFPRPNASIAKGENIMFIKHITGGYTVINNFIDSNNEPQFRYKYYKTL